MIEISTVMDEFSNIIDSYLGDKSTTFNSIDPIGVCSSTSLVFANNSSFLSKALGSDSAIIVTKEQLKSQCTASNKFFIFTAFPDLLVSYILQKEFYTKEKIWNDAHGVSDSAVVSSSVSIGKNVFIGNNTIIGENCIIGDNVYIASNVIIKDSVSLGNNTRVHEQCWIGPKTKAGDNCLIRANTSVGVDSFKSSIQRTKCKGSVLMGDNVEIGSQTCIDRPIEGETQIQDGVKLDNLVKIGAQAIIKSNSLITAGVQIGEGADIGKFFMIGGNSFVEPNTVVCDGVLCGGLSYIDQDIIKAGAYAGNPAQPMREYLKTLAGLAQLPRLRKLLNKK